MRYVAAVVLPAALAACGSGEADKAPPPPAATPTAVPRIANGADSMASRDPAPGETAKTEYPDPVGRPIMQAQVVLDRLGFSPGVIDGKPGLSTTHAIEGFQQANGLAVSGALDEATKVALARWNAIAATRVVRIPEDWGDRKYRKIPRDRAGQAQMQRLGYESLDERLAERFHTTIAVLKELNPGGRPAGMEAAELASGGEATAPGNAKLAEQATPSPSPKVAPSTFLAGQLLRVPNVGADRIDPGLVGDKVWQAALASLGVGTQQPHAAKVVVDRSDNRLEVHDAGGKLVAGFTVTAGSRHDPLPLGTWGVVGIEHNPHFSSDPEREWRLPERAAGRSLPPGPNGPAGVVWIALSKAGYGIHGTDAPETVGRAAAHGDVRLTNWDAARLALMVDRQTRVVFEP